MRTRSSVGLYLICSVVLWTSDARADLAPHVVAAWLFDEGTGALALDSVNEHHGELVGSTGWTPNGMFGPAIEFPGEQGNRIEVPDDPALTLETWTISAWVKVEPPVESADGWAIVVVKDPANGFQNYGLDFNGSGSVVSEVTDNGAWSNSASVTSVYDEEWHFIAASYDGDVLTTFVDGEYESEQEFGPGDENDAPLSIGDRLDGSQPLFGIVDDLGLFNVALPESDLLLLMENGLKAALSLGGIPGDFDESGELDAADIDALSAAVSSGSVDLVFDLNGDAVIDSADRDTWIVELKNTYVGDANLDGQFDSGDFVSAFQAGQYEDGVMGNSTWSTGDWNGDREFDTADFVVAFQVGGFERGPRTEVNAVPEPASFLMLAAGLIGLAVGRRRHAGR